MKLELAVIADDARIDPDGKLSIIGIFDRIGAPRYPATHGKMLLVLRFLVHRSELGKLQRASIQLVDADGRKLFEAQGEITPNFISRSGGEVTEAHLPQIIPVERVTFPHAGRYSFDILINGSYVTSIVLTLAEASSPPS